MQICALGRDVVSIVVGISVATAPVLAQGNDAGTRRALLVGIDTYKYPQQLTAAWHAAAESEWGVALAGEPRAPGKAPVEPRMEVPNLSGPVNDVVEVGRILKLRYDFTDVRLVTDTAATRHGILAAIQKLIDDSRAGDVVVFYYAGHGSERVNSKAPSPASADNKDQTIVPADANAGQFDIRNVELNKLFEQLLAKNVKLTLIFDSCHSGSAVRGLVVPGRNRLAPFDMRDAEDPSDVEPIASPGRANRALFLAAAQEHQLAAEDTLPDPVDHLVHGTFTRALLDVIRDGTVDQNLAADEVFKQVGAIMRWREATQVPVLKGTETDPTRPLFGTMVGSRANRLTLAYQGAQDGSVLLDGGAVIGLAAGSQLVAHAGAPDSVRIELTGTNTLTISEARVVSGDIGRLRPGTLFLLDASKVHTDMALPAWIPKSMPSARLAREVAALSAARSNASIDWVTDPTSESDVGKPLSVVQYDGARWSIRTQDGKSRTLSEPTAAALVSSARALAENGGRPRVYLLVPPSTELVGALRLDSTSSMVTASPKPLADGYALFGQVRSDGSIAYAWVYPNGTAASRLESPFPPRTDWVSASGAAPETAASLQSLATRLGNLYYWLTIKPQDAGVFDYQIGLHGIDAGHDVYKFRGDTAANVGGEKYQFVIRKPASDKRQGEQRYVYVFGIDSRGTKQLLFGQSKNFLPDSEPNSPALRSLEILPIASFRVCAPYGLDVVVMVASSEAIPNPLQVFQGAPIVTRGFGDAMPTTNWTIDRMAIRSVAPPPGSALERATQTQCKKK